MALQWDVPSQLWLVFHDQFSCPGLSWCTSIGNSKLTSPGASLLEICRMRRQDYVGRYVATGVDLLTFALFPTYLLHFLAIVIDSSTF